MALNDLPWVNSATCLPNSTCRRAFPGRPPCGHGGMARFARCKAD